MSNTPLTFQDVAAALAELGLVIQNAPGEYRVNFRNGDEATSYYTISLSDALATGRQMAEDMAAQMPPPALPPLGPTGRRNTRRGAMLLHNRKLAARRRALSRAPAGKGKKPC